jgi:hypothetical protein
MAAITGAALAAGTAIYGANQQKKAGQAAANAAQQGSAAEIAERARQFDLTRADYAPYQAAGTDALARQQAFLNGDRSGFENDAGYQFIRDEQQRGLERSASSRGALYNGGTSVDLMRQMTGLANQTAGDYWNRLAGRAGQGQTMTSGLGALGANMANQNAMSIGNATGARQSSYLNTGAANAGMAGALGGMFNNWYQQNSANNGGGSGWYFGNNPGKG